MGAAEDNARRLFELGRGMSDTIEGDCTAVDWVAGLIDVNVGGATQSMPWAGEPPAVGGRVRVVQAGVKPFGVAVHGSPLGTVASVASNIASVAGDDGRTYDYPYLFGVSLSAGHRVVLDHAHQLVIGRLSVNPTVVDPVVPPRPPSSSKIRKVFRPTAAANYWYTGGRWETPYAEVSDYRAGCYFYGAQIANTIPDNAVVYAATLTLAENWDYVPGTASRLGLHAYGSVPGGAPSITGGYINVTGGGDIDITSFAQYLINGSALGVGFLSEFGHRQFGDASRSGTITIDYR